MGTHNVHRAAELLREAQGRTRPLVEILEEAVIDDHAMFPSALPARRETTYNAWVTIQIGCDNNCAFCIVPAVRGTEISRPYDDVLGEVRMLAEQGVTEVTLLGQNVNSYGRDLQLAARQRGDNDVRLRPLVRRPAARRRCRRRHPPRAVHQPAPQGHAARDVCGDGRHARRLRAPPLPAAVGQRSRAGADAPRLHRRALSRTARRCPPQRARPGGVDRHHRRLPG